MDRESTDKPGGFSDRMSAPGLPREIRALIRHGWWTAPTAGCCPGYTQVNLVIVPQRYAFDFLLYCQRNPKPCPVLEVLEAGIFTPKRLASGVDIRTDIPLYRVFTDGQFVELTEITDLWRADLVSFLIGCSFTFEQAMLTAGLPVRHVETGRNVPMFITNIDTDPAGPFTGPLVVTMRPVPAGKVSRAITVTARFPGVHGAPIHVGPPESIGIADLSKPDFGDPVEILPGEIPVFWACGVTPQMALLAAKPEMAITHAPGHMLITDRRDEEFSL